MTLEQAKQALLEGNRVRHKMFEDEEWIEKDNQPTVDELVIRLEDNHVISFDEFMKWRQNPIWKEGWSIIPKEDNTVPTEDENLMPGVCVLCKDEQSANGLSIITKVDYIKHRNGHTIIKEGTYKELSEIMSKTPNLWDY